MARMSGKKLAVLRMPIAAVTACNALLFLLAWDPASTWMANSLRLSAALMLLSSSACWIVLTFYLIPDRDAALSDARWRWAGGGVAALGVLLAVGAASVALALLLADESRRHAVLLGCAGLQVAASALMFSSFVFPGRPPRVGTYRVRF
ncbi:MAG TPA: hypothetical protein VNJ51_07195 [Candidatus Dormibacteraeota bacterium]|nr:hypothetical protein [Candidatus Dormibacteraeota bacterium]